jgi:hypothetical protein
MTGVPGGQHQVYFDTRKPGAPLSMRTGALDQEISNPEQDPPAGHRAGLVFVQKGEVLAVWALYRLGQSLPRNLASINELAAATGTSQS